MIITKENIDDNVYVDIIFMIYNFYKELFKDEYVDDILKYKLVLDFMLTNDNIYYIFYNNKALCIVEKKINILSNISIRYEFNIFYVKKEHRGKFGSLKGILTEIMQFVKSDNGILILPVFEGVSHYNWFTKKCKKISTIFKLEVYNNGS